MFDTCAKCFIAGMEAQWNEGVGRILLGDWWRGGHAAAGHAAAGHLPTCCSLDLN
jgi:hypothetical protein